MGWNHRYIYCLNLVASIRLILKYFLSIWTECLLSKLIFNVSKFSIPQQLEAQILCVPLLLIFHKLIFITIEGIHHHKLSFHICMAFHLAKANSISLS